MRYVLEHFESGWDGLGLALRPDEIDSLMQLLLSLKNGTQGHFHLATTDYSPREGLADVEFGLLGEGEMDNMAIG